MIAKPNCFIVGSFKCGTTSMHNYLAQHPLIGMSSAKETYFFAPDLKVHWRTDTYAEYSKLFSNASCLPVVGESTPGYLYSECAAENIRQFCAEAKIIVMLRQPADMMYSLHGQLLSIAYEDVLDFSEALRLETQRKRGVSVPQTCHEPKLLAYRQVAHYSDQVARYVNRFGEENVHCIIFEDLARDPDGVFRETLRFLKLDDSIGVHLRVHNAAQALPNLRIRSILFRYPWLRSLIRAVIPGSAVDRTKTFIGWKTQRQRPSVICDRLRTTLTAEMADDIQKLAAVIGRDLSHWLTPKIEERARFTP